MDLRQLRYFVAIASAGSLSKASEHLRVAQPALSLQLANLEADLGAKLFERYSRGVKLTQSGTLLLQYADQILKGVAAASQAIARQPGDVQGQVSLGMPTTVSDAFATTLLRRAQAELPGVRITLSEHSTAFLRDLLDAGALDMAILMNAPDQASVQMQPLLFESYVLFSALGKAGGPTQIEFAELATLPLLLPSGRSILRIAIEEAALQAGLQLNVVAELDSARLLLAATAAGLGHTILPRSVLPRGGLTTGPEGLNLDARLIVKPEIRSVLQLASSAIRPATAAQTVVRELILCLVRDFVAARDWDAELHWSLI